MEFLFFIIALIIALFIIIHLRALTDDEVKQLGIKRRNKKVEVYYSHDNVQYLADRKDKKAMPPYGSFFTVNWKLQVAPPIAASFLKFKKHEWIMIAFEKERIVSYVWMNKGLDSKSVGLGIQIERVQAICRQSGYKSVLLFHNHINSRPSSYTTGVPSQLDQETTNNWAQILNGSDISLLAYICERGVPYRFLLRVPDSFFPISNFIDEISELNGVSWFDNFPLHMERIF